LSCKAQILLRQLSLKLFWWKSRTQMLRCIVISLWQTVCVAVMKFGLSKFGQNVLRQKLSLKVGDTVCRLCHKVSIIEFGLNLLTDLSSKRSVIIESIILILHCDSSNAATLHPAPWLVDRFTQYSGYTSLVRHWHSVLVQYTRGHK